MEVSQLHQRRAPRPASWFSHMRRMPLFPLSTANSHFPFTCTAKIRTCVCQAMASPMALLLLLLLLAAFGPAAVLPCSPPLQHFTGLPPAKFSTSEKNVLLIGDSISMGGDPHSDPVDLHGAPGGYGSYVLRLLSGHNIVSVQHNGGAYNGSKAAAGNEQAGNTEHGLDCLDYWIGRNATNPRGLPWDVIHVSLSCPDLSARSVDSRATQVTEPHVRRLRSAVQFRAARPGDRGANWAVRRAASELHCESGIDLGAAGADGSEGDLVHHHAGAVPDDAQPVQVLPQRELGGQVQRLGARGAHGSGREDASDTAAGQRSVRHELAQTWPGRAWPALVPLLASLDPFVDDDDQTQCARVCATTVCDA